MNVSRAMSFASILVIMALALAACGGGGGGAAQLTLEAQDIKWDKASLTAQAGQTVNLTVANTGALEHNFSLDAANVSQDIAPGATQTITFTAPAAGDYEFYCNTAGHKEAGMVGTFTSTP